MYSSTSSCVAEYNPETFVAHRRNNRSNNAHEHAPSTVIEPHFSRGTSILYDTANNLPFYFYFLLPRQSGLDTRPCASRSITAWPVPQKHIFCPPTITQSPQGEYEETTARLSRQPAARRHVDTKCAAFPTPGPTNTRRHPAPQQAQTTCSNMPPAACITNHSYSVLETDPCFFVASLLRRFPAKKPQPSQHSQQLRTRPNDPRHPLACLYAH